MGRYQYRFPATSTDIVSSRNMDCHYGHTGCVLLAVIWLGFASGPSVMGTWMGLEDAFSLCGGIVVIWLGNMWSSSFYIGVFRHLFVTNLGKESIVNRRAIYIDEIMCSNGG